MLLLLKCVIYILLLWVYNSEKLLWRWMLEEIIGKEWDWGGVFWSEDLDG